MSTLQNTDLMLFVNMWTDVRMRVHVYVWLSIAAVLRDVIRHGWKRKKLYMIAVT